MDKLWGVWEIEEKIGQGSFGEVYKAYKKELGRTFYSAIKHISLPKTQDEINEIVHEGYAKTHKDILNYYKDTIDDLVKEIEIMYELRANKNIVDYQDHLIAIKTNNEIGYDIYIRMELLKSLDKHLETVKMDENEVIKLGKDIATALEVCNNHHLLHRDIKPANIFVDENGTYKLGDFGVARRLEKTTYGMSKKGTYNYMSPEIYKGDKATISSDIYSLGIVMYRLLNNNRSPFIDKNATVVKATEAEEALIKRMNGEEIPKIEGVNKNLMSIIKKACSFYQKDRYKDPKELLDDLNNLLDDKNIEHEEQLEKTVSIYDDQLEKTVSIYQNDLEKTVSIYDTENKNKKGNYESDEELRERIRKIMAEESINVSKKKKEKLVSINAHNQHANKIRLFLSFFICLLLVGYNILIAINAKNIIIHPEYLRINTILKNVLTPIILTDIIVLFAFLISIISRRTQRVTSYLYLINIFILCYTSFYVSSNNCRLSTMFFGLIPFQIFLFFNHYKWVLGTNNIEVEEKEIDYYKKSDQKLEKYYSKPYKHIVEVIISVLIILTAVSISLIDNSKEIKKQGNERDSSKVQIVINTEYINIRKKPSTSSTKLGQVLKDEIYTVLDKVTKGKDEYYYIETNTGIKGYIIDKDDWITVLG